jgi:hypothetical protein
MSNTRKVYVRYTGKRQFFIGVPARDLTKEEFDGLSPEAQRDVLESTIYERVTRSKKSDDSGEDEAADEASNESESN